VAAARAADYAAAWEQILEWTRQGRSWSGKERHNFFLNTRDGRFTDTSAAMGLDLLDDGRGVARCDWDNDGDIDFWTSARTAPRLRLLRNDYAKPGNFITVQLHGTHGNRDAIGARVRVLRPDAPETTQQQSLRAGEGFLSQSSKRLHFGLGESDQKVSLEIRWPDGLTETVDSLQVNRHYEIEQASGTAKLWQRSTPAAQLPLAPSPDVAPPAAFVGGLLAARHRLPPISYQTAEGGAADLFSGTGTPRLVVHWSSTCAACLVELRELTAHEAELRAAHLQVLALSVDGLGSLAALRVDPAAILGRFDYPFESGSATVELLDALQQANNDIFTVHRPLPLPVSFLLDGQGQLAAIYKGPVSVPELLRDVANLELTGDRLLAAAVPAEGWWQSPPRGMGLSPHIATGVAFAQEGKWKAALAEFEMALRETPDSVEVHLQRGRALAALGETSQAITAAERAVGLAPEMTAARLMLGDLYLQQRQLAQALPHYLQVLQREPAHGDVASKLGLIYASQGKLPLAIKYLRAAVATAPQNATWRANLGKALLDAREYAEASRELSQAIELPNPPLAAALNLSSILAAAPQAELRDAQRALVLAQLAVRQTQGSNPAVLRHLAVAYAELGEFDQALATASLARDLAERRGDRSLVAQLALLGQRFAEQLPDRLPAKESGPASHQEPR
jgi:tetratricopeptide (TPR) repeat protein